MNFIILWNVIFFSNDRKIHLNKRFCKNPNIIKFNELMNTNNIAILKSLAKFVKKIFNAVCSSWLMHLYLIICLFVLSTYLYICYMTLTCNDTFIWIFLFVPHVPVIWFWVNKWIELKLKRWAWTTGRQLFFFPNVAAKI